MTPKLLQTFQVVLSKAELSPVSSDGYHVGGTLLSPMLPFRVAVMGDSGCIYVTPKDLWIPLNWYYEPLTGAWGRHFLPVNL